MRGPVTVKVRHEHANHEVVMDIEAEGARATFAISSHKDLYTGIQELGNDLEGFLNAVAEPPERSLAQGLLDHKAELAEAPEEETTSPG